ncbi:hypothetical protein N9325_01160 [Alphaproteobacteria bacterium]|nr:hypothetical protein [Alphaproteobacteria bacterium]
MTILAHNKMFYIARDYHDRHYLEDRKMAVVNTTRDVFQGSNKVISPYLDPIQHRRLETIYDARFFLLFYFFEVLIDQAVYTVGEPIAESFMRLNNIPKFFGILGGASNLPPEQLLSWFHIYNKGGFHGRLGNVSHLFYRLCEYHFLIYYPRLIEAANRQAPSRDSLRSIYHQILTKITNHMFQSYERHHGDVRAPYMPLQTIKVDSRLYREWIHVVLSFARNTLNTI